MIDSRVGRGRSETYLKTRSRETSAETKGKMSTPTLDEYGTDLTKLANEVLFWAYIECNANTIHNVLGHLLII